MSDNNKTPDEKLTPQANAEISRRAFLKFCARCAAAATAGAAAWGLTARADAEKVWQLNAGACNTCEGFRTTEGWGQCATRCVAPNSAVKAVNDFTSCGYCFICPAYFDVSSEQLEDGTYEKKICPQDAIIRTPVGEQDPYDPFNNFYQYTIDEEKCNGCGLCVLNCKPPMGNASLRLEVRHDRCLDCNSCNIANNCPTNAFYRRTIENDTPGYAAEKDTHSSEDGH